MNVKKTANAILYFISMLNSDKLDVYRIVKLLYLLDSRYFKIYGRTTTELEYAKLPYGPAPDNYTTKFAQLQQLNYIHYLEDCPEKYACYAKNFEPELDIFDESEKELLSFVVNEFGHKSFLELKQITHNERPYNLSKYKLGDLFDFNDLFDTDEDFLDAIKPDRKEEMIKVKPGDSLVKSLIK